MRAPRRISATPTSETCTASKHGTAYAWIHYRCRCPEARADKRSQWDRHQYSRSRGTSKPGSLHHRDVDPAVVFRLVLGDFKVRSGTTEREIAERLGLAPRSVGRIRQRLASAS